MKKWKTVRVAEELVEEAEKELKKSQYKSLSEFVSESIRLRLQTLTKDRISTYLERDEYIRTFQLQEQVFYTPKHIWTMLTPKGTVKLGVSDYFYKKCHGITYIETVKIGEKVSKDEPFGIIETPAWWFIHDLVCPVDGEVVEVNHEVISDPLILSGDPYQWIVEIQPNDPELSAFSGLLSLEEYKELIATKN